MVRGKLEGITPARTGVLIVMFEETGPCHLRANASGRKSEERADRTKLEGG